uniref:PRA1 family protein n=1 Tax=Physcomitrium patens TaxID=3218 RepID=A0A7I4AAL0_PHYPA
MDWSNVTIDELVDALKEVEWSQPPRPLAEFFAKFTVPKTQSKWDGRVKCNMYYFAVSLSEKLTRTVRRFSPPLAHKLRAPVSTGTRGRPLKGTVYICGRDRRIFVGALGLVTALLWWYSSAVITILGALIIGITLPFLHASFRTPNLKARLNSFREEFRAVWRGYSDA